MAKKYTVPTGGSIDIDYGYGALVAMWCGISPEMGLYLLPWTSTNITTITKCGGQGTYFNLEVKLRGVLTVTNVSSMDLTFSMNFISL